MGDILARCNNAIMASITDTQHLGMIHAAGRCPGRNIMTGLAHFGGIDVAR